MKKDLKNRKLSLDTETIKTLDPQTLEQANGGIIWTVVPISVAVTLLFCGNNQAR